MSGDGIFSVRLPPTLLEAFRAMPNSQGLTINDAARRLVAALASLSQDDLEGLKDPPPELGSPRISLYVGWRYEGALCAAIPTRAWAPSVGKNEKACLSTDTNMNLCKSWATQGRVKTGNAGFSFSRQEKRQ